MDLKVQHTISTFILFVCSEIQLQYYGKFTNAKLTRNSKCLQTQYKYGLCTLILMPFTKVAVSLYTKPGKHKLHMSASSLIMQADCSKIFNKWAFQFKESILVQFNAKKFCSI